MGNLISSKKFARLALVAALGFTSNLITSLWAVPFRLKTDQWWQYMLTFQPLPNLFTIATVKSEGADTLISICLILAVYGTSIWAVVSQSGLLFRVSANKTKLAFALAALAFVAAYFCALRGWYSGLGSIGLLLMTCSLPNLLTFWVLMTLATLFFRRFGNKIA